jgi:hypothetical protein
MPVLLATQEAEIRKITVGDQSRDEIQKTPSQSIKHEYGGMHLSFQLPGKRK